MVGTPRRTHTRRNKLQDTIEKMYEKIGLLMVEMQKTQRMVKTHLQQRPVGEAEAQPKAQPEAQPEAQPSPISSVTPSEVGSTESAREVIPRGRSDWHYFSANYAASNPDVPRNKEFSALIADEFQRWKDMHPGKSYADYRGSSNLPARRRRMTKRAPKLLAAPVPVQRTPVPVQRTVRRSPVPLQRTPSPLPVQKTPVVTPVRASPLRPLATTVAEEAPIVEEAPAPEVQPVYDEADLDQAPAPETPAVEEPVYDEADLDQAPEDDDDEYAIPEESAQQEEFVPQQEEFVPQQEEVAPEEEGDTNVPPIIRIGDTEYFRTRNNGLFQAVTDDYGNVTMGDWVGYLEDDGVTIRETETPQF
jgi:hypothetical protein